MSSPLSRTGRLVRSSFLKNEQYFKCRTIFLSRKNLAIVKVYIVCQEMLLDDIKRSEAF